jgi:tetratricopeptide (TPR) repeat protein
VQATILGDMVVALISEFEAALKRGDRSAIVDLSRQFLSHRPNLDGRWIQLAMILAVNGEVSLARQAADLHVEHCARNPHALLGKADLLAFVGAWPEMLALLREWPASLPQPPGYSYARGTAALYVGDAEEARQYLVAAIRRHPDLGIPWLSLNLLVDYSQEPELAELVIASERIMEGSPTSIRGTFYYALGKVHADRGDYQRALDAFAHGARLMKEGMSYSRDADRNSAAEAVSGYDARRVAAIGQTQSEPTERTIFVMGLPRSGTTLVEQILTSHSTVTDGAEIYRLGLLARDIGSASCPSLAKLRGPGGRAACRPVMEPLD